MTGPDDFEVGVVLRRTTNDGEGPAEQPEHEDAVFAEYEDASGGWIRRRLAVGRDKVEELGEGAVRIASAAVASQITTVAEQVAAKMAQSPLSRANPGQLGVDTVDLTFGITLTAGLGSAINAFVTAEGESSFDVTISLRRQPS